MGQPQFCDALSLSFQYPDRIDSWLRFTQRRADRIRRPLLIELVLAASTSTAWVEVAASVVTPDVVETSRGPFDFTDGMPVEATAQTLHDQHDFSFICRAFMDGTVGLRFAGR